MSPLVAAALVVLLEVMSFGAIFPVMAAYCAQLGGFASDAPQAQAAAGAMFALVGAPRIFMNIYWGRLSDHLGRRPALALITTGTMIGSLLWVAAPALAASVGGSGLIWLGVSRLVAGVFQAEASLTQAVAADVTAPDRRAAAMGLLGAAFGLGLLGGIVLGGLVGHYVSLPAVGFAAAAAQLASLLVIVFALRETHPSRIAPPVGDAADPTPTPDRFERLPIRRLLRLPAVAALLAVTLLFMAGHMVLVPVLPVAVERWFDADLRQVTWVFSVWMLVGVLVQGGAIRPIVRRCGERATIALGFIALAGGFVLFAMSPGAALFWLGAVLIAIGGALATPALTALISHAVSPADQGAVQGLHQSATAAGRTVAYGLAALVPLLIVEHVVEITFAIGAVVVALALALLLATAPRARGEANT